MKIVRTIVIMTVIIVTTIAAILTIHINILSKWKLPNTKHWRWHWKMKAHQNASNKFIDIGSTVTAHFPFIIYNCLLLSSQHINDQIMKIKILFFTCYHDDYGLPLIDIVQTMCDASSSVLTPHCLQQSLKLLVVLLCVHCQKEVFPSSFLSPSLSLMPLPIPSSSKLHSELCQNSVS